MPVRYLLALATMKSGPPSVDEVEYLRARYATIVCGACSFALMLAFPLVLRRRVDKLRRARALGDLSRARRLACAAVHGRCRLLSARRRLALLRLQRL